MRQKLKYWDQIVNREMTPRMIVTCGTITATWHNVNLTRGKIFNLKKIQKKNKKIQELTHGTPFNAVTTPLTERT